METHEPKFIRADIWREGKWLDLWSVVHLFTGISIGFGFSFFHFDPLLTSLVVLTLLIIYEWWEWFVKIEETKANRILDVVVGMIGFLPMYFILAPRLSMPLLILAFGFVFTVNTILSIFGWRASQKAAELEKRLRIRYAKERMRLREQRERFKKRFRRRKNH